MGFLPFKGFGLEFMVKTGKNSLGKNPKIKWEKKTIKI